MKVEFRRSAARRYGVKIERSGLPPLEKDPAPGFDERMPHDLVHFVVERTLELRQGIFGQVAAGGTCGQFLPVESHAATPRGAKRERRALARRSDKLMEAGNRDIATSESAVYVALAAWQARRAGRASVPAPPWMSPAQLRRICDELDAMSESWVKLRVGEAIAVDWPGAQRSS